MSFLRRLQDGNAVTHQHDGPPCTPVETPVFRELQEGRDASDTGPRRELREGRGASDNGSRRELQEGRDASDTGPRRELREGRGASDNGSRRELQESRGASDNGSRRELQESRDASDTGPRRELREGSDASDTGPRREQQRDEASDRTARRMFEERRKIAESKARRRLRTQRTSREITPLLLKHKRVIVGTAVAVGAVVALAAVVGILASRNTKPITATTTTTSTTTTFLLPSLSMQNVTFFEGEEDLYLLCTISGDEEISEVLFFKDDAQLKDGYSIDVNGRQYALTKKGATCSDSGKYMCRATGEFGTIYTASTVNISAKPCKPTLKDAWQIILNNISSNPNSMNQQGFEVPQACNGTLVDAERCCYLIDNGGITLHLKGCENFTFTADVSPCDCTADRVAVPRPTTYPDNCNLYYTCSGGVKQDATCTGSDFTADPSKQACTANPDDSYCAKVKAGEIKACSSPAG
ncbi:uncharacterized protein LOC124152648 isoform X3 [Haliotis rufescens]|uniref:uncharacterized protein LOC124152648 isoform X3 n=1 Tax=Haliotis rufescens TaxID=6454 RepID=UPI00201F2F83|nr:uncharacterized protein LOC124152648 isoform X3 [Haliotis rufescens]